MSVLFFADLIFNRMSGFDEDYYDFEVKAENGIITDFKEIDWEIQHYPYFRR